MNDQVNEELNKVVEELLEMVSEDDVFEEMKDVIRVIRNLKAQAVRAGAVPKLKCQLSKLQRENEQLRHRNAMAEFEMADRDNELRRSRYLTDRQVSS